MRTNLLLLLYQKCHTRDGLHGINVSAYGSGGRRLNGPSWAASPEALGRLCLLASSSTQRLLPSPSKNELGASAPPFPEGAGDCRGPTWVPRRALASSRSFLQSQLRPSSHHGRGRVCRFRGEDVAASGGHQPARRHVGIWLPTFTRLIFIFTEMHQLGYFWSFD